VKDRPGDYLPTTTATSHKNKEIDSVDSEQIGVLREEKCVSMLGKKTALLYITGD
jgi:hypothetical protein